ncbi:hypothetical protein P280DRAFT_183304 [Massarina eburnea CBS 473.64]|uniref:Uncharacterized protein n=1 Tax=Massarina eburnea CBS 473.64 TaxID=1395130 RepID=A0A6A6SBG6_9PLEO|nr:hypothetical protein P280DRAFT_183304 [Massarina eburnea CBS 473.64]
MQVIMPTYYISPPCPPSYKPNTISRRRVTFPHNHPSICDRHMHTTNHGRLNNVHECAAQYAVLHRKTFLYLRLCILYGDKMGRCFKEIMGLDCV